MNNAANNRPYAGFSGLMPLSFTCCLPIHNSTKWTEGTFGLLSQIAGNPFITNFRGHFPGNELRIVSCCALQPLLPKKRQ